MRLPIDGLFISRQPNHQRVAKLRRDVAAQTAEEQGGKEEFHFIPKRLMEILWASEIK